MNPVQSLHYALGELAYAVAFSDGKVQKEEREKFHNIVAAEVRSKDYDFDISDIIFQIMEKDKRDSETVYNWALKQIRLNSHYLSPDLKKTFINVMDKIAKAYPPESVDEINIIQRFKMDIASIVGDPVYYNSKI